MQVEVDGWENESWGLFNIERRQVSCQIAVSSSGSRANRCETQTFHHYFVPAVKSSRKTLYLRPPHAGYEIDDGAKVARGGDCDTCGVWELNTHPGKRASCLPLAIRQGFKSADFKTTGSIAGLAVERYRMVAEDGVAHETALAVDADCEVMERVTQWKGSLGIPGAVWRYRVTSYIPGEPARSLFEIPPGCRIEPRLRSR